MLGGGPSGSSTCPCRAPWRASRLAAALAASRAAFFSALAASRSALAASRRPSRPPGPSWRPRSRPRRGCSSCRRSRQTWRRSRPTCHGRSSARQARDRAPAAATSTHSVGGRRRPPRRSASSRRCPRRRTSVVDRRGVEGRSGHRLGHGLRDRLGRRSVARAVRDPADVAAVVAVLATDAVAVRRLGDRDRAVTVAIDGGLGRGLPPPGQLRLPTVAGSSQESSISLPFDVDERRDHAGRRGLGQAWSASREGDEDEQQRHPGDSHPGRSNGSIHRVLFSFPRSQGRHRRSPGSAPATEYPDVRLRRTTLTMVPGRRAVAIGVWARPVRCPRSPYQPRRRRGHLSRSASDVDVVARDAAAATSRHVSGSKPLRASSA